MALSEIDRSAVLLAVAEFDELGRDAFLAQHGFGRARSYFLLHDGKLYDSKAIVGAAHGFARPGEGALKASDFSGGEATDNLDARVVLLTLSGSYIWGT